jgi:hypothetical protein
MLFHHQNITLLKQYSRRLLKPKSLDFRLATSQMLELCYNPSNVFRLAKARNSIKGHYARDDPAFFMILSAMVLAVSFSYSLAFHSSFSIMRYLGLISYMYLIDFLLIGLFVTTGLWYISNKYFIRVVEDGSMSYSSSTLNNMFDTLDGNNGTMEWLYCFDIHCNAFFPLFLIVYVVNFFLLPIHMSLGHSWIGVLLGNTSIALGLSAYIYVTFRGFIDLPFTIQPKIVNYMFVYPMLFVWIGIWMFSSFLLRVNLLHLLVRLYFSE